MTWIRSSSRQCPLEGTLSSPRTGWTGRVRLFPVPGYFRARENAPRLDSYFHVWGRQQGRRADLRRGLSSDSDSSPGTQSWAERYREMIEIDSQQTGGLGKGMRRSPQDGSPHTFWPTSLLDLKAQDLTSMQLFHCPRAVRQHT